MTTLRSADRTGFRFFNIIVPLLLGLAMLPAAEDAFAAADSELSGLFYDPANSGHGFDFNVIEQGLVVYYYGHTSAGERLWLISGLYTDEIEYDAPIELDMYEIAKGVFGIPAEPTTLWGTVTITMSNCTSGNASFTGIDGGLEMVLVRLATPKGVNCDAVPAPEKISSGNVVVQYKVPEDWKQFRGVQRDKTYLYSPTALEAKKNGSEMIPAEILVSLLDNSGGSSLADFISSYKGGWYSRYSDQQQTIVQGYSAIMLDDSSSSIPSSPSPAAFVEVNDRILKVTANVNGAQVLEGFLSSLDLTVAAQ